MNFVRLAVDHQVIPGVGLKIEFRSDRAAQLAVDHPEERESIAESTGANIIIVLFVLDAKRDPGHLLILPGDEFQPGLQDKVIEDFAIEDEQRKVGLNAFS